MAFETREELLEKYIKMEKPVCPDCRQKMSLWEVPPINFSDGLGWGTPYLFVCFNDDCPSYKSGWQNLRDQVEIPASYRCYIEPGTTNFEYMPVFRDDRGAFGQTVGLQQRNSGHFAPLVGHRPLHGHAPC